MIHWTLIIWFFCYFDDSVWCKEEQGQPFDQSSFPQQCLALSWGAQCPSRKQKSFASARQSGAVIKQIASIWLLATHKHRHTCKHTPIAVSLAFHSFAFTAGGAQGLTTIKARTTLSQARPRWCWGRRKDETTQLQITLEVSAVICGEHGSYWESALWHFVSLWVLFFRDRSGFGFVLAE